MESGNLNVSENAAKVLKRRYLAKNEKMTIGQCRSLLGASRKYLLPFLEQMDREGLTIRKGDHRTLRNPSGRPG